MNGIDVASITTSVLPLQFHHSSLVTFQVHEFLLRRSSSFALLHCVCACVRARVCLPIMLRLLCMCVCVCVWNPFFVHLISRFQLYPQFHHLFTDVHACINHLFHCTFIALLLVTLGC